MSERPKCMPSDEAIRACSAVDHVESANMKMYVVTATGALLHKTGLRAQIAVLEESMDRMKAHLGLLQNAEVRYAYELLRDRRDALRKELEHG